jgi:S1-C subfamily serine protease
VIQSAGHTRTPDAQALSHELAAARPGQQVTITLTRGTQDLTVQVTLGDLPGR